jgi:hypothetical protein
MNYSYKLIRKGLVMDKCSSHSLRVFLKNLRTINWQHRPLKVLLKVSYGKRIDNFGKLTNFDNEGEYDNKKDLWQAFMAFTEDEND